MTSKSRTIDIIDLVKVQNYYCAKKFEIYLPQMTHSRELTSIVNTQYRKPVQSSSLPFRLLIGSP